MGLKAIKVTILPEVEFRRNDFPLYRCDIRVQTTHESYEYSQIIPEEDFQSRFEAAMEFAKKEINKKMKERCDA